MKIGGFEVGEYVVKESGEKRYCIFDCKNCVYGASIAEDFHCRFHILAILQEIESDLVVLAEVYERVYDEEQTTMLSEIANLSRKFAIESVWSYSHLSDGSKEAEPYLSERHNMIVKIAHDIIDYDPILAYSTCLREYQSEYKKFQEGNESYKKFSKEYLETISYLLKNFESCQLIQKTKSILLNLKEFPETVEFYRSILEADIKPSFIASRLMFKEMESLELLDEYTVGKSNVQIFKHPDKTENLYFINPPEYSLPPDKYFIMSKTREVVAGYKPGKTSLSTIAKSRKYFERIYESTIKDVATAHNLKLSNEEISELAEIVGRYTVGYGILEILLSDRKITDIFIDSPIGQRPLYVVHADFGQCQTNILYTSEEASGLVSKLRAMSARPFDEAHPVLDYDIPELDTRIAVIGPPLAPDGMAFAFRLHKVTPWTLPQFIDVNYLSPLAAGMISFFIDAQATSLITGSRGSGKTSLLQACMLEILQNTRIIVQEDSVAGDSEIVVQKNGKMEFTTVGELIDGLIEKNGFIDVDGVQLLDCNPDNVQVFSMGNDGKISLKTVSQFSRHFVSKDILEVGTKSGRKIKVTCDHSLFSLNEDAKIVPIKTSELSVGKKIAVPKMLPFPENGVQKLSVLEKLLKEESCFFVSPSLKEWIACNFYSIVELSKKNGFSKSMPSAWKRNCVLPAKVFRQLQEISPKKFSDLMFKLERKSKPIPVEFDFDENFLLFSGLWFADGCFDGRFGIILSVGDENSKKVFSSVCESFGLKSRMHSDGFSSIVSNINFVWLLKNSLGFKGNAFTKKFPAWVFNLSLKQQGLFLNGLFSGDGYVTDKEIGISLVSEKMPRQIQSLLLNFGIFGRTSGMKLRDKTFKTYIGHVKNVRLFREKIGFIVESKSQRLEKLCKHNPSQDNSDTIPLSLELKQRLSSIVKGFNTHDYIVRNNSIGRSKLQQMIQCSKQTMLSRQLEMLACSDIFWDEIVSIKKIEHSKTWVYDFSVPKNENFICQNIIAHNTLEIPVPYLKRIGFNIQRLKTRSPISVSKTETEVAPEEALRTALRLGDSALVIGEVRSKEAKVLYEAMRVGAAGNIVIGTIHGDSAYSIWDRVVNDLGVPNTSFKATDLVVVARPIRFSGSMKRSRRVVQITEVKKHWTEDPEAEGGLLDLMLYDAKKDELELLEDNLKESELFDKIRKVSGLSLDQIWSEIRIRADSKKFLVDLKREHDIMELLEAENYIVANNKLILVKEEMLNKSGKVDYDQALGKWKFWVKNSLLKRLLEKKKSAAQFKGKDKSG